MSTTNPRVDDDASEAERERERAYYALHARLYPLLAHVYDPIVWLVEDVRRQVTAIAGVKPTSRVLDAATGTGAQARAFAEKAAEVVGVDLSEDMLRVARRKSAAPNLRFERADATTLPFDDASFDVASISMAFHEMPETIRLRVLRELHRVTTPEGTVAIVDYGRPPGRFGDLAVRFFHLYERRPYLDFLASDLPGLVNRAGLDVALDVPLWHSTLRILVCRRRSHVRSEGLKSRSAP